MQLGYQLNVIRVRPFNHIGPGQSERFAVSSFAKQLIEIEKGLRGSILYIGDLETQRDITDVRDVVRAYQLILEGARSGEAYNGGSGKAWEMGDLLEALLVESNIKKVRLHQQPERIRTNEIPVMLCDASKIRNDFGWRPGNPIHQTLRDLLEYWRTKLTDKDTGK